MKMIFRGKKNINKKGMFIAIGVFDGVHVGHMKILNAMIRDARRKKKNCAVVTFFPHPDIVLHPDRAPKMLSSLDHRVKMLSESGVDAVYVCPFTKALANLKAERFIRFLKDEIDMAAIYVGQDFCLGNKRKGDTEKLIKLGEEYGFTVHTVKSKMMNSRPVSSTRIRQFVEKGKMKSAGAMLGRVHSILGTVVHGNKRGRILGFPTANLDLHHEAVPPAGVWAVVVRVAKKHYSGILNIGFRPTFHGRKAERTVEVHIFNLNRRLYGKDIEVFSVKRIRREKRFKSKEKLICQIRKDMSKAMQILEKQRFE